MNRGILIAVEGIDGAGKTTLVERLADFLGQFGESVVRSKEPTNGVWGQKIRKSASIGRMKLEDELWAFIEDRKEHLRDVILPALANGQTVILDRYFYSTIAYQGSRGGDVDAICKLVFQNAIEPDAVVVLDVAPEIGLTRVRHRGEIPNEFEQLDNLAAARQVFRQLAMHYQNIILVDASPDEQAVKKVVLQRLLSGVLQVRYSEKGGGREERWAKMMEHLGLN